MGQPSVLEALTFEWAHAYVLGYSRDRWVALRRDSGRFLVADTLTGLEHAIQRDYRHPPVSRDGDPLGTADHLNLDDGGVPDDGDAPDEDARFILAALQFAFPAWTITCSPQLRAWIARTSGKTICQNSPVLLCAALTLIEGKEHRARHDPGWDPPP